MKKFRRTIRFWFMEFLSPKVDVCGLCGNSGVLDTRGVRSPLGVECGVVAYCICPNGCKIFDVKKRRGLAKSRIIDETSPDFHTHAARAALGAARGAV